MNESFTIPTITLLLPLLGGALAFLIRNDKLAPILGSTGIFLSLLTSLMLVNLTMNDAIILRFAWFEGFEIGWSVDRLSAVLMTLVCFISFLVHVFSADYMKGDPGIGRYYGKLGFFTFSMLGLLAADHLILFFIFWELVGFSSYLLIGFWFHDENKAKASRIAFMTNRVADAGFLMGILILWSNTGNLFISDLEPSQTTALWAVFAGGGLLMGALGKSAQFPFFTWLPHAMAGPTPVSALIHAATMVAAGVYLLVRVYVVFPPEIMTLTAVLGAVTATIGSISALTQFDVKSVLAYSTISQLGYMVLAVGVGAYEMAIFHLWTHAFFKAGLFLSAGSIIHYLHHHDHDIDAQDMRLMGGLKKVIPVTFISYLICMLALSGLPLFSGFLSKDGILIAAWGWAESSQNGMLPFVIPALGLFSALLTAFYMGRQLLMVFFGNYRGPKTLNLKPEALQVKIPLLLLAIASFGFYYSINPFGHHFAFLDYVFGGLESSGVTSSASMVAAISTVFGIAGLGASYLVYKPGADLYSKITSLAPSGGLGKISFYAFHVDWFYMSVIQWLFDKVTILIGRIDSLMIDPIVDNAGVGTVLISKLMDLIDKIFVDGLVNLTAKVSEYIAASVRLFHASRVQLHFVWAIIGIILILISVNFL